MNRRGFLTSFSKNITKGRDTFSYIHLPYIANLSLVEKICKECEKPCVNVCETGIIATKENIPVLDLSKNGCTFCKKCADVCGDRGVLDGSLENYLNIIVKIKTLDCLSWNQTMCSTCKEVCRYNAIDFFGLFRPTVNKNRCTGCGICIGACPVNAIEIVDNFSNIKEKK